MKRATLAILVMVFLVTADAKRHKPDPQGGGNFDFYVLSLSWAPSYCAGHPTDRSSECRTGNRTGFVLHGLWPQSNQGAPPMSCQPASPVAADIVRRMQAYFPSRGLIQHEWEKHGTCSGLSASEYFARVELAFKGVRPPDTFNKLGGDEQLAVRNIEQDFATANHAPADAFRISCHAQELVSVDACLTKDLQYRSCGKSVRECPTTPVLVRPPK